VINLYLGLDITFVNLAHIAHQNIAHTAAPIGHHTVAHAVHHIIAHAVHCDCFFISVINQTGSCHLVLSNVSSNTVCNHLLNVYSLFNLSKSGLFLANSALKLSANLTCKSS
jgi:hypothetical protein